MQNRIALARDALVVLAGIGPATGAEVRRELQQYRQTVNSGQFYVVLDRLVRLRLVEKNEGFGRSNQYDLTQAGYRMVADRRDWTAQFAREQPSATAARAGGDD